MVVLVKGVRRKGGDYEGNAYDNVYLQCVVPADNSTLCGELVEAIKMKALNFYSACKRQNISYEKELVDRHVRIYYNKYGNADDFDVIASPEKKN